MTMFRIGCLYISHFPPASLDWFFRLAISFSSASELSEVAEPDQSALWSQKSENTFTDPTSMTECVELLEEIPSAALQIGYDAWSYVNFCDRRNILKSLIGSYRRIWSDAGFNENQLTFNAPETLCV